MSKKTRTSKYWICSDCADKKKWVCTDNAITVISGLCGYCKRKDEDILIPIVDFKRGKIEPIFD